LGGGEQWVKGAKAGWKAGRRLESLPHIRCLPKNRSLTHKEGARHQNACTIVGVGMSSQANHRQDCRCGKQDCLLHANIRCGTQDCVLHAEAGMASLAACSTEGPVGQARGRTHWSAPTRHCIELIRGRWGKGPRPTGMLGAGLEACPSEGG